MSTYLPSLFGENLMDMFDDFDRDFSRAFSRPEHVLYGKNAGRMMKTDVKETDNGYEVDVDLPGFRKEDIHLELNDGYLTISAAKTYSNDKEDNGKVLRQERYSGSMQRSFYVGDTLTEEDIKAKYENGVLSLVVPKKEAQIPQKRQIMIE
ncbi:MAG: Hsp20/alpha crystallin family protein [Clostridia bacterium]|nr:Hsp20/alpha crystallin family protein [Clostridia bacterium]